MDLWCLDVDLAQAEAEAAVFEGGGFSARGGGVSCCCCDFRSRGIQRKRRQRFLGGRIICCWPFLVWRLLLTDFGERIYCWQTQRIETCAGYKRKAQRPKARRG